MAKRIQKVSGATDVKNIGLLVWPFLDYDIVRKLGVKEGTRVEFREPDGAILKRPNGSEITGTIETISIANDALPPPRHGCAFKFAEDIKSKDIPEGSEIWMVDG